MNKLKLLTLLTWVLAVNAFGQTSKISFKVINNTSYPIAGKGTSGSTTSNASLNSILTSLGVTNYHPDYPAAYRSNAPAKFGYLKDYYAINIDTIFDLDSVKAIFQNCTSCGITEVYATNYRTISHTPNDYRSLDSQDPNCNWFLTKIKAQEAWEISKSKPEIKIAILDRGFDLDHPDFANGKVAYSELSSYYEKEHGTATASIAAGNTNDNQGTSSIGYNSSLMFYKYSGGNSILSAALDGAQVINLSVIGNNFPDPTEQQVINDVYASGVFIVAGAGNGMLASDPKERTEPNTILYPAAYDHVFSVTSVWSDDAHRFLLEPTGNTTLTHQHNPKVDLCAPGFHIMHAMPLGGPLLWDQGDGTSFAAPLVAGTVALIKAEFPCLSNDQIELILKQSSDNIYALEPDNMKYIGKLGAGRLNAYEALKLAQLWYNTGVIFTGNPTISSSDIYNSITVKAGSELTISGATIYMASPSSKITVEPGAKLILSGCTIKAVPFPSSLSLACSPQQSYKWQGIIVEGNPGLPQTNANQGYLSITSSIIEDAMNAVSTVAKDVNGNVVWAKSGGAIVVGVNSTFINNARHLEFSSYHSRFGSSGAELNNLSNFRGCKFYVDNGAVISVGNKKMITLWDVYGIKFNSCEFRNAHNTSGNDKGTGILAVDAGVIIQNNKATGGGNSLFKNLEYGIDAACSPSSGKLVNINNCNFESNRYGICLKQGLSSSIYRNNFDTRNTTFNSALIAILGLQTVYCSGFRISENSFLWNKPDNFAGYTGWSRYGAEIRHSDIYSGLAPYSMAHYTLNGHVNMATATQLEGNNGLLNVACNSYYNYAVGIRMNPTTSSNMRPRFGDCSADPLDRNNTFDIGTHEKDIDLLNHVSAPPYLDYVIKKTEPLRPFPWRAQQMNILPCDPSVSVDIDKCIPFFPQEPKPDNGVFDHWDPTDNLNEYGIVKLQIPNYPYEAGTIDANLYPKYIKLAQLRTDIIYAYNNLLLYDEDNVSTHLTNYIQFLENEGTIEARKTLVPLYYNSGMISDATQTLQTIPVTTSDNSAFVNYYQVLLDLHNQEKNIYQMNPAQEFTIRSIAGGTTSTAVSAQGILNLVYDERVDYNPEAIEVPLPDVTINEESSSGQGQSNYSIAVSPNPIFKSNISTFKVTYMIVPSFENALLRIVNQYGEIIESVNLTDQSGEVTIGCDNFQTGLYVVQLIVDGQIVSYKLINLLN